MNTELLMQNLNTGLVITIIGMLTVLFFLTVMIIAMTVSKSVIKYINKIFPEEIIEPKKKTKQVKDDSEIALAIALAHEQMGGR